MIRGRRGVGESAVAPPVPAFSATGVPAEALRVGDVQLPWWSASRIPIGAGAHDDGLAPSELDPLHDVTGSTSGLYQPTGPVARGVGRRAGSSDRGSGARAPALAVFVAGAFEEEPGLAGARPEAPSACDWSMINPVMSVSPSWAEVVIPSNAET